MEQRNWKSFPRHSVMSGAKCSNSTSHNDGRITRTPLNGCFCPANTAAHGPTQIITSRQVAMSPAGGKTNSNQPMRRFMQVAATGVVVWRDFPMANPE